MIPSICLALTCTFEATHNPGFYMIGKDVGEYTCRGIELQWCGWYGKQTGVQTECRGGNWWQKAKGTRKLKGGKGNCVLYTEAVTSAEDDVLKL